MNLLEDRREKFKSARLAQITSCKEANPGVAEIREILNYLIIEFQDRDSFFKPTEEIIEHFCKKYLELYGLEVCQAVFQWFKNDSIDLTTYKQMSFSIFGDKCKIEKNKIQRFLKNTDPEVSKSAEPPDIWKQLLEKTKT